MKNISKIVGALLIAVALLGLMGSAGASSSVHAAPTHVQQAPFNVCGEATDVIGPVGNHTCVEHFSRVYFPAVQAICGAAIFEDFNTGEIVPVFPGAACALFNNHHGYVAVP